MYSLFARSYPCRLLAVFGVAVLAMLLTPSSLVFAEDHVLFKNTRDAWPEFRGPLGDGHVRIPGDTRPVGLPLRWSETENVRWKTAIPDSGWSTPVVMDGRVWLTWATPDGHSYHAVCVNADTGAVLFDEELFRSDNPEPLGNEVNGYASPSPAVESGRVYVHFGSYGTACLDTKTFKVLWKRQDLPCRHYRGPGSSVFLYKDMVILTLDGADVQYLTALDKKTGKTIWRTDRSTEWQDLDETGKPKREGDCRKAFSTPLAVEVGGKVQLISPGSSCVFAYAPDTGKELWKFNMIGYSPSMRVGFGGGLVFATSGQSKYALYAIRPDGQGDVSASRQAWQLDGPAVPQEPSPIVQDGLLYLISNAGLMTCRETATGTEVWSQRLGGGFQASPIYADGLIYCFNTQGKGVVIKAGRTCEIVATNELDTGLMASPAVAGKALYLRTKTHLYRIEEGGK